MKTNLIIALLIAVLLSSCGAPWYVPTYKKIDVNEYGSRIKLSRKSNLALIKGELIAIDSNNIIVLTEVPRLCVTIPVNDVLRFKLKYAKLDKHYGWTIPTGLALPFIHGFVSILTIPLHLIVTITVTASGENAFTYNKRKMDFEQLKMFARFPQGIPANVELTNIN